jgi:hypothetical protein
LSTSRALTGASDMKLTPVGIDIAKSAFQVHYVDEESGETVSRPIKRAKFTYRQTATAFRLQGGVVPRARRKSVTWREGRERNETANRLAAEAMLKEGFCRGKTVESCKGDMMRIPYITNE